MAAAGVDASNTGPSDRLLVLPDDPDAEAARLRRPRSSATWACLSRRLLAVVSATPPGARGATASPTWRSAAPAWPCSRTCAAPPTTTGARWP